MLLRSPLALVLEQALELSDLFIALQNEGALPAINLRKRSRRCEDQVGGQAVIVRQVIELSNDVVVIDRCPLVLWTNLRIRRKRAKPICYKVAMHYKNVEKVLRQFL